MQSANFLTSKADEDGDYVCPKCDEVIEAEDD